MCRSTLLHIIVASEAGSGAWAEYGLDRTLRRAFGGGAAGLPACQLHPSRGKALGKTQEELGHCILCYRPYLYLTCPQVALTRSKKDWRRRISIA